MKAYKWMHAATAAALLGAFVGCDDQDFDTDPDAIETQPADTYDANPTAPAPREELQQNSQNNPLGDPAQDDTLDSGNTLNSPAVLDDGQSLDTPRGTDTGGAPAPVEQSPLEELDEDATSAGEEDATSEGDEVTEDVTEEP